ncbi:MAG: 23S rRNA (guanosine(2251)-2'-O)-methyltransferase RlmB [Planctomycetota bacterium]|nr:23S rRNA (guanosine(2251)-2'-O)-methyltransferase RlmB [Planctomycetota bacterium]
MVERSRRGKGKQKLLGSHQRSWLWGRNLVQETLRAGRWPIHELLLADDLPADLKASVLAEAVERRLAVRMENRDVLARLAHTSEHQGFLAKMGEFPYTTVDQLLASAGPDPLLLVLDAIQDPYNFGAMLRSARAFGVDGVIIGGSRQVPVTSMVARSSAGVINRVKIARVDDLATSVESLRERSIRVLGAAGTGTTSLAQSDLRGPTAILIGNEGVGVSRELLALCDGTVSIPLDCEVESLNAAAAAAVFFYEARRQRR